MLRIALFFCSCLVFLGDLITELFDDEYRTSA
jgi:hypothetical protein